MKTILWWVGVLLASFVALVLLSLLLGRVAQALREAKIVVTLGFVVVGAIAFILFAPRRPDAQTNWSPPPQAAPRQQVNVMPTQPPRIQPKVDDLRERMIDARRRYTWQLRDMEPWRAPSGGFITGAELELYIPVFADPFTGFSTTLDSSFAKQICLQDRSDPQFFCLKKTQLFLLNAITQPHVRNQVVPRPARSATIRTENLTQATAGEVMLAAIPTSGPQVVFYPEHAPNLEIRLEQDAILVPFVYQGATQAYPQGTSIEMIGTIYAKSDWPGVDRMSDESKDGALQLKGSVEEVDRHVRSDERRKAEAVEGYYCTLDSSETRQLPQGLSVERQGIQFVVGARTDPFEDFGEKLDVAFASRVCASSFESKRSFYCLHKGESLLLDTQRGMQGDVAFVDRTGNVSRIGRLGNPTNQFLISGTTEKANAGELVLLTIPTNGQKPTPIYLAREERRELELAFDSDALLVPFVTAQGTRRDWLEGGWQITGMVSVIKGVPTPTPTPSPTQTQAPTLTGTLGAAGSPQALQTSMPELTPGPVETKTVQVTDNKRPRPTRKPRFVSDEERIRARMGKGVH